MFIISNVQSLGGFDLSYLNSMKFWFQRMTLKIEQVFEKINKILSQNMAKRAMNLLTKKDHNKCKISFMKKKLFSFKIISLYTINSPCVVIEIYAS